MSNGFKKFIDTDGKSFEEIKRLINNMVSGIVDDIVDDVTEFAPDGVRRGIKQKIRDIRKSAESGEYKSEKIPPRLEEFTDPPPQSKYPPRPFEPNSIAYPHEPIPENMNPQDEFMLDKIREMRDLEKITHNSYIVTRCALDNLIVQGDFMANVEDDFGRRAFCGLDMPIYAAMSNSQLRTYFTWRTDVRRKKFPETDKPYVILYCFELMNKIGGISSDEAFDGLCAIWENCRGFTPYLNRVMPRWIKDFYAFNNVTGKLPEFPEDESRAFSLADGDFSGKLELLADNSSYPIRESVFLTDETRPLMDGACEAALTALSEYFAKRGLNLGEILCGAMRTVYSWSPFANALVDLDRQDGFREVETGERERYRKKRGTATLERFEFSPSRGIIGYILKSTESELRVRTGKARKLTAKITMLQFDIRNKTKLTAAVEDEEFQTVIPKAVSEFCDKHGGSQTRKSVKSADSERSEYVRAKVEIDVSKLAKIREESDDLAKKLVIPEEVSEIDEEKITEISEKISEDDFSEQTEKFTELTDDCRFPVDLPREWRNLARSLSATHIAVLDALMSGNGTAFCREQGLMPETVCEEINTAALEQIGDVIIESGVILEDYSEEIEKIIKSVL